MRWWPPSPGHNGITTRHEGLHPTDPPYQISPKPSLVTSPSIKSPCHSSLGNPLSKALTTSLPHLLDLNTSIRNNLFVKPLCLNVKITIIINNVRRCPLLSLIPTLYYALAKTTYQHYSTLTRPIIRLIKMHLVSPSRLVNPMRLINPHRANRTNPILLTTAIREATKKGYMKSVIKKLIHIQRVSIQTWSRKVTRFNIQINDLTK